MQYHLTSVMPSAGASNTGVLNKYKIMNNIGTYSIWVQEMGADLRCKCSGIFWIRAQVGLHRQVKQLWKTCYCD